MKTEHESVSTPFTSCVSFDSSEDNSVVYAIHDCTCTCTIHACRYMYIITACLSPSEENNDTKTLELRRLVIHNPMPGEGEDPFLLNFTNGIEPQFNSTSHPNTLYNVHVHSQCSSVLKDCFVKYVFDLVYLYIHQII